MSDLIQTTNETVQKMSLTVGLTETDWSVLKSVSKTTLAWDMDLADIFEQTVLDPTAEADELETASNDNRKQAFAVWLGAVLSGELGSSFWPETYLMGLDYASAGFTSPSLFSMSTRIEEEFFKRCRVALDAEESEKVYFAFKRVFSVAVSMMVDSSSNIAAMGMQKVGVNEKLFERIKNDTIKAQIEKVREALPLIEWNESLCTRIDSIDEQHKKLVDLLNALHNSSVVGKGSETLKSILNELVEYTKYHFSYEEQLMKDNGYPDVDAHIKAHLALTSQVIAFNDEFQAGKGKLSGELFNFLRNWLNGHIRGTDKKYTSFFTERGVN